MDLSNIDDFDNVKRWSYSLAKQYVIENVVPKGIDSSRKFTRYAKQNKLPRYFPKRPDDYFRLRGTWQGWYDFFGKEKIPQKRNYYEYEKAVKVTRAAGIRNSVEFRKWKERPYEVPCRPEIHYDEWKGWKDFLGEKYSQKKSKGNSKLKESDVRIIKQQLNLGVSGSYLAKHFNVSEMQISRIKKGENW